jgi:hypothetical protein
MNSRKVEKYRQVLQEIVFLSPFGILGEQKLRVLLWLCDKYAFLKSGKTMTDEIYLKKPHGPGAKHFYSRTLDLQVAKNGFAIETLLVCRPARVFRDELFEFVSIDKSDSLLLSWTEKEIIKNITERYMSMPLEDIQRVSSCRAWETASSGIKIEMFAVFADKTRPVTDADLKWAVVCEPACDNAPMSH